MRENCSSTFMRNREQLGKGAYGTILKAVDDKGNEYAIKCCLKTEQGINFPLEVAVMTSLAHPNLNSAIHVLTGDKKVEIIQHLANCDMRQFSRSQETINLERLRKWCFQMAQGLSVLHQHQLIHGDIKANNVLLFDDVVKLSDFGLVVRKLTSDTKFAHKVCTSTHRPPEVFLNREWNESIDIWSLGCTFYEIAFGHGLFSSQESFVDRKSAASKRDRDKRLLNALVDWFDFTGQEHPGLIRNDFEYTPCIPCDRFRAPHYQEFNNLILAMLRFDPGQRLTIAQVLGHPFFDGLTTEPGLYISRPFMIFPPNVRREAEVVIGQLCHESAAFKNFVYTLYSRCSANLLDHVDSRYLIAACALILYKMLGHVHHNFQEIVESYDLKYNVVIDIETIICQDLNYHLM